jgi:hypothetical protein
MQDAEATNDPFAHLRERANERAHRTVERTRAGIAALQAAGQRITAESLKHVTRDLEPDFTGLSFQVIRRNPRAYALYREAADAFTPQTVADRPARTRRRRVRAARRRTRFAYDPLQRLGKRDLVRRIRVLEQELEAERQRAGGLAYDRQAMLARQLRLETEIILLQDEHTQSG